MPVFVERGNAARHMSHKEVRGSDQRVPEGILRGSSDAFLSKALPERMLRRATLEEAMLALTLVNPLTYALGFGGP